MLSIIAAILIIFMVAACRSSSAVNKRGNTAGNIINGGIVAIQGDWIYYSNQSDDGKLYTVKTDGSKKKN